MIFVPGCARAGAAVKRFVANAGSMRMSRAAAPRRTRRANNRPWSWSCYCCYCSAALLLCCLLAPPARADTAGATSNRAARDEAIRAIPWQQMSAPERRAAQFVVKNTSIYRRLPTRVVDCDPDLFTFLVQHPEVVTDVWRMMGVSQVALEKLPGGGYRGADGAGTSGTVRFLHADWGQDAHNLAVVYADGAYEGKPFVMPLKARSLILLRSGSVQETNGRHYVTVRIDSFLHIEQMGVEFVARTVQPWINKTADQNFIETLTFVSNFSRTAERNPRGIERLATRLPNLDEPTRHQLVALSFRTAERYAHRDGTTATSHVLHRPGNRAETGPVAAVAMAPAPDPAIAEAPWIGPITSKK